MNTESIALRIITRKILFIRGYRVMLDHDLAELYQVKTKALNQAVKRNINRFPTGFMFQLKHKEMKELVTNCDQFYSLKHAYKPAMAFTEHGISMLSSILKSKRAVHINIQIIQAFIRMRMLLSNYHDLREKMAALERKYDKRFAIVFRAMEQLLDGPEKPINVKGFNSSENIAVIGNRR